MPPFLQFNPPTPWGQGVLEQWFRVLDVLLEAQNRRAGHFGDAILRPPVSHHLSFFLKIYVFFSRFLVVKNLSQIGSLQNVFFLRFFQFSGFRASVFSGFSGSGASPGAHFGAFFVTCMFESFFASFFAKKNTKV